VFQKLNCCIRRPLHGGTRAIDVTTYRLYTDAIARFQAAVQSNPNSDDAWYDLADAYFRKRDYSAAREHRQQQQTARDRSTGKLTFWVRSAQLTLKVGCFFSSF
jgi:tetratricopeptide (TPR) repeat protein